jgi:hypothetical protein
MFAQLTSILARTRHEELLDTATRRRRGARPAERRPASWDAARLWQGLTVRLATGADGPALAHLAGLEEAPAPSGPVLLGVVIQRPVAALSLSDGRVLADPFTPTADLIELLRRRARQLGLRR